MFSISFDVQKSIRVSKSMKEVKAFIEDFNTWKSWSPCLCQEKDCAVIIEGQVGQIGRLLWATLAIRN